MSTEIKMAIGQCASDTSDVDVVIGGESRTPTGAIFLIGVPTALNTTTNEARMGIGFTDFSTSGCTAVEASHDVGTTDCNSRQEAGLVMGILSKGLTDFTRSFTATAITGGVRVTSAGSGSQYQFVVMMVFDSACKMFAAGAGITSTNTFSVAHGFSSAPKAAIFSTVNGTAGFTQGDRCIGLMAFNSSTIVQRALIQRSQLNQADGEAHGELRTDTCVGIQANNSGQLQDSSITTVDATNVTFTQNTATKNGNVLGLLIECDDIATKLITFDASNSNSVDWDIAGVGFTPQAAIIAMSQMAADDAGVGDDPSAGSYGICVFDDTVIGSVTIADENAADNTDTASRTANALYLLDDNNTVEYDMDNPSFNSDGVTFASADITTADAGTHRFAGLFFGIAASSGIEILRRRRM